MNTVSLRDFISQLDSSVDSNQLVMYITLALNYKETQCFQGFVIKPDGTNVDVYTPNGDRLLVICD